MIRPIARGSRYVWRQLQKPAAPYWVVAGLLLPMTVFSYETWVYAQKTVNAVYGAASTGRRAWLAPGGITLAAPMEIKGPLRIDVALHNTGDAPALRVKYAFSLRAAAYSAAITGDDAALGPNGACKSIAASKGDDTAVWATGPIASETIPFSFTAADSQTLAQLVKDRKAALVIDGCVTYFTLNQPHRTLFRYFLHDADGDSFISLTGAIPDRRCMPTAAGAGVVCQNWLFALAPQGNSAD